VLNDDGSVSGSGAALDCPLCLVGHVAPPVTVNLPEPVRAVPCERPGRLDGIIAAATAAPPPSRGPPTFF